MNNKGFAITTILYGILVLFCLLLVSLLGVLSSYRKTQEKLINENNGARSIVSSVISSNNTGGDDVPGDDTDTKYQLILDCGEGMFDGNNKFLVNAHEVVNLTKYICKGDTIFWGWGTSADAASVLLSYEMPEHDVTLYAIWKH